MKFDIARRAAAFSLEHFGFILVAFAAFDVALLSGAVYVIFHFVSKFW